MIALARGVMRHILAAAALVWTWPAAVPAAAPQNGAYVKRPASGGVIGYVISAESREPIEGTLVSVQANGAFAESGPTTAHTDATGRYRLRAPLGRSKSSTKVSPLVIFGEPIRKRETNTIDPTQLNVSVTCAGYEPFLGPVSIRHAAVSRFKVYLAEILLAPEGSALASFAPGNFHWEHLEDFTVTPDVVERGNKLTMTARLRVRRDPDITYRLYAIAPGRLFETSGLPVSSSGRVTHNIAIQLHSVNPGADDSDHREFTATARVRRRTPLDHARVYVVVFRGTRNVTPVDLRPVLVLAPGSEDERGAAELCREGHYLRAQGELSAAVERVEAAVEAAPEYKFAHELLGDLYMEMNRPEDAVRCLRKLVALAPDDVETAYPMLAEALVAAGKAQEGVELLRPLDKDATKRKQPTASRMPPRFNTALGRCYLALRDFGAADDRLKRAGLLSPDLRRQVAIERAHAMLAASPESVDARAGLARALADAERWDEAIGEFHAAAESEDADAWRYTDLAWALMQGAERYDEAAVWAEQAVSLDPGNAEARLRLGDCYRRLGRYEAAADQYAEAAKARPFDFYARHWNGMMLLCRGETEAAAEELAASLALAREKGEHRPRYFAVVLLVATTKVLVHGFRYPEAEQAYIILDALTTLRTHASSGPDAADFISKYNMAAAFVELGLPEAGLPLLRECLAARPDYTEALYASARAHMDKGEPDIAEAELHRVVEANPLHPRAYLDLAKLRLAARDGAAAQRYVLQHRRNYPESAPRTYQRHDLTASERGHTQGEASDTDELLPPATTAGTGKLEATR